MNLRAPLAGQRSPLALNGIECFDLDHFNDIESFDLDHFNDTGRFDESSLEHRHRAITRPSIRGATEVDQD